jgi:prepilin-type N-terminal cleavage/methylation domain-containing protein
MEYSSIKDRRSGFTLIELLVVISIIALLMAIMMPALSRVRESAKSTVCKSHIKQLVTAAMLWAEDNDGHVVPAMWHVPEKHPEDDTGMASSLRREATENGASLEPYTGSDATQKSSLYTCPSATKFGENFFSLSTSVFASTGDDRRGTISYGVNEFAVIYTGDKYVGAKGSPGVNGAAYASWGYNNEYCLNRGKSKLAQVQNAASTVYFTDFSYPMVHNFMYNPLKVCYSPSPGSYAFVDTYANVPNGGQIVQARWHGKVDTQTGYGDSNIGWFDGSVTQEPEDFDDPDPVGSSGGGGFGGSRNKKYSWQRYFFDN